MIVVEQLIAELGTVCAGLPDQRKGPSREGDYTMADIGLSAFSLFFVASPSFLAYQRAPERGQGRSKHQTLFGMSAIPSDNYIRPIAAGSALPLPSPARRHASLTAAGLGPAQGRRRLGPPHHHVRLLPRPRAAGRRRRRGHIAQAPRRSGPKS